MFHLLEGILNVLKRDGSIDSGRLEWSDWQLRNSKQLVDVNILSTNLGWNFSISSNGGDSAVGVEVEIDLTGESDWNWNN